MTLQICRKHFLRALIILRNINVSISLKRIFPRDTFFCCYFKLNKYVITVNFNFLDIKLKKKFYATLIFQTA